MPVTSVVCSARITSATCRILFSLRRSPHTISASRRKRQARTGEPSGRESKVGHLACICACISRFLFLLLAAEILLAKMRAARFGEMLGSSLRVWAKA